MGNLDIQKCFQFPPQSKESAPSLKLTVRFKKWVFHRHVLFQGSIIRGELLVSGRVSIANPFAKDSLLPGDEEACPFCSEPGHLDHLCFSMGFRPCEQNWMIEMKQSQMTGGGFKYFGIFIPLGEDSHFDFFRWVVQPPIRQVECLPNGLGKYSCPETSIFSPRSRNPALLSIESWLVNRDPGFMV